MYKKIIILLALMLPAISANCQNAMVKKAAQATFSLNTFRADGTPIATSHGIFTNANGDAISEWKPFVGAAKAVVIDSKGRKHDVDGLISANELYNVCKFHVSGQTDTAPLAKQQAAENSNLWIASYSVKAPKFTSASVSTVEMFSVSGASVSYPFYILKTSNPEDVNCCPVINDAGEVVALVQSVKDGAANAIAALYPTDMQIQAIGDNAATLAASHIAPMLPSDYANAQLALILAAQQRKGDAYKPVVEQFIKTFPQKPDGYQARARMRVSEQDFSGAKADMEKAISVADDKAEAHNAFSMLMLDKEIYMADVKADGWSYDNALKEAQTAYSIAPEGIYLQQQGKILYAMQKYDEAYDVYMKVQDTNLGGPENMYAATQCKQAANAPFEEVMALMDSTIAVCPHPLTYQSAPYIFLRGNLYQENGQYRKAVNEYNHYEKLMVGNRLPADFYYKRFVCEREGRLYQQALEDIVKATELAPGSSLFFCEKGSLEVRLKMNEEAIASANKAILLDRRNADAYAILGVAQCVSGKKHEGLLNLEEAKSLGYEAADALISKYK